MVMLKLFATLTFVLYAVYVYFDDFDYINKEKKDKDNEKVCLRLCNCSRR